VCVFVCECVCVRVCVCVCLCVSVYLCVYIYMCVCMCVCDSCGVTRGAQETYGGSLERNLHCDDNEID